jgi:hypothetical protein
MKEVFVTTFNEKLHNSYAKQLIESYLNHNHDIPLIVYHEDKFNIKYQSNMVSFINLFDEEPDCKLFVERNKDKVVTKFFKDAVRFCYKVYAQKAATRFADKIYYVDSDSVFIKEMNAEARLRLLPENVFISFYDRPSQYTETGFLGFNTFNKELSNNFFNHYSNYYKNDTVYNLEAQTDCHTLDATRQRFMNREHYKEKKLGDGKGGHIMARCPLIHPYLDHRKGKRKEKTNSPEWIQYRHRYGG